MLATCPVHLTLLDFKVFPQSVLHTLPHSKQSLIRNLHFICSQRNSSINTHPYLFTLKFINFSYDVSTFISSFFTWFWVQIIHFFHPWKCKSETGHYSPTTACGLETGHTVDCASWSWLEYWEIANCKLDWCGQTEAWQASLLLSLLLYSAYSLDQGMPGK